MTSKSDRSYVHSITEKICGAALHKRITSNRFDFLTSTTYLGIQETGGECLILGTCNSCGTTLSIPKSLRDGTAEQCLYCGGAARAWCCEKRRAIKLSHAERERV